MVCPFEVSVKKKQNKNFPVYSMTRYVIYSDRCLHGQQQWQMGIFRFTIRKEGNHILLKGRVKKKIQEFTPVFICEKKTIKF